MMMRVAGSSALRLLWLRPAIRCFAAAGSSGGDGAASGGGPIRRPLGPGPQLPDKAGHFPGAPCWSCEQVFNPSNEMFCNGCNKLLPLLKEENYFQLLGLPVSLYVDRETLERNFQNMQRKVHPDRYMVKSAREQAYAAARSAAASAAYQTIGDPIARAKYVLAMKGIDLEACKLEDPSLVIEVMEAREMLETAGEAELRSALERHRTELDSTIRAAEDLLRHHGDQALTPITHLIVRAQYYAKLVQEAEERLETQHPHKCSNC